MVTAHYERLVRSHAEMEEVLVEAEKRRSQALAVIEFHAEQAGPFPRVLSSTDGSLAEAARVHADAAVLVGRVQKAVRSGVSNEPAYQALRDAVTRAGHTVLGMTSVISNCLQICEIRRIRGEEPCDPAVIAAVRPLLDLKTEALAALP